MPPGDFKHG
ncbi:phage tail protein, P2 GpE family [Klebsiella pneumoniae UHKPC179]|nr:phage tail protein, P2 GpE family [Klebsiella pneumoniae UHKPC57]EPO96001.1 phage tail protein, P2 GpE family [Klebsiella pneumoniae UHKPC179]